MFHPRCGHCVSLSNGNKTACRTNPHHEFNRGLVFSLEPIKDNEVFEVQIDRKLNTWSGSVEIGVTVCNPDVIDIPFTATDLRGGTWVLLGHGVLRDGRSVMEAYGCDLDQLVEGDRVGVMRSAGGELEFYVNGESQGIAAMGLPPLLYAVVDMYGKCAQITLTHPTHTPDSNTLEVDSPSELSGSASVSECCNNHANNNNSCSSNAGVPLLASVNVKREQHHQRNRELILASTTFSGNGQLLRDDTQEDVDNSAAVTPESGAGEDEGGGVLDNLLLPVTQQETGTALCNGDAMGGSSDDGLLPPLEAMSPASCAPPPPPPRATSSPQQDLLDGTLNGGEEGENGDSSAVVDDRRRFLLSDVLTDHTTAMNSSGLERDGTAGSVEDTVGNLLPSEDIDSQGVNCSLRSVVARIGSRDTAEARNRAIRSTESNNCTLDDQSTDEEEENDDDDAADKGNEKSLRRHHVSRQSRRGPSSVAVPSTSSGVTARVTPAAKDSNIILSNTENLCRLLNVTMETLIGDADRACAAAANIGARSLNDTTGGNVASALTDGRASATVASVTANADGGDGTDDDAEEGGPDADVTNNIIRLNNRYGFNSSFINNTINSIRQSGDQTPSERDQLSSSNVSTFRGTSDTINSRISLSCAGANNASRGGVVGFAAALAAGHAVASSAATTAAMLPAPTTAIVGETADQISNCGHPMDSNRWPVLCSCEYPCNRRDCVNRGRAAVAGSGSAGLSSSSAGVARRSCSGNRRTNSVSNSSSPYRCGRRSRTNGGAGDRTTSSSDGGCGTTDDDDGLNDRAARGAAFLRDVLEASGNALTALEDQNTVLSRMGDDHARLTDYEDASGAVSGTILYNDTEQGKDSISTNDRVETNSNHSVNCGGGTSTADAGGAGRNDNTAPPPNNNSNNNTCNNDADAAANNFTSGGGGVDGGGANNNNTSANNNDPGGNSNRDALPPAPSHHLCSTGVPGDRLRFHEKCGLLVRLSNNGRTAERRLPFDEFNNGVVMSNRALRENELFEIRIDRQVSKWSGSIEVGITTHDPTQLDFPATMTNLRSGTTMMSGTGILRNGKGMLRQYGDFNLDELREGDRIGMMIRSDGTLHYYINGLEQGIASNDVPSPAWCVVDLYGMTVKVTLADPDDDREQHNLRTRLQARAGAESGDEGEELEAQPLAVTAGAPPVIVPSCEQLLLFSAKCGRSAEVINGGLTAHRPRANEDFNHGVVLTSRPLQPEELLEVRLDKCVAKWAGSLEIGVTSHSPHQLDYPSTMTNVRSGTWMMTGNGVMHNGTTVIDEYGLNLDRLRVGDRVGVLRKADGSVHFFVNGVDQGSAATKVPDGVYGVVDLYGQAAQATIVQHQTTGTCGEGSNLAADRDQGRGGGVALTAARDRESSMGGRETMGRGLTTGGPMIQGGGGNVFASVAQQQPQHCGGGPQYGTTDGLHQPLQQTAARAQNTIYSDLRFHHLHGRNARIINGGLGAERPHADAEFNDAIVMSSRQLHEGEMFEVMIEREVDRWSGSLEAGVTAIPPEDIEFPSTMTDIDYDTWMLSGCSVMMNGGTIKNNYACDLDSLPVGSRIGMMRHADATLHYYVNGIDKGVACTNLPSGLWAVVDLYGKCSQVSIVHNPVSAEHSSLAAMQHPLEGSCGWEAAGRRLVQPRLQRTDRVEPLAREEVRHRFSYCHGSLVAVSGDRSRAHRASATDTAGLHAPSSLAFTNTPLACGELFEVRVTRLDLTLQGSLRIGLTTLPLLPNRSLHFLPPSLSVMHPVPPSDTWWIGGSTVFRNSNTTRPPLPRLHHHTAALNNPGGAYGDTVNGGIFSHEPFTSNILNNINSANNTNNNNIALETNAKVLGNRLGNMDSSWSINVVKYNYCPHLTKLVVGDRVGVKRSSDGCLRLLINGEDYGVAAAGIPSGRDVHGVVELHGSCVAVETSSFVLEESPNPEADNSGAGATIAATAAPQQACVVATSSSAAAMGAVSQDSLELSTPQPRRPSLTVGEATPATTAASLGLRAVAPLDTRLGSASSAGVCLTTGGIEGAKSRTTAPVDGLGITASAGGASGVAVSSGGLRYSTRTVFQFSEKHGKNVQLSGDRSHASRKTGYDHGLLCTTRPLARNTMFRVVVGGTNPDLSGGVSLGLSCGGVALPDVMPRTANQLLADHRYNCFLITGNEVYHRTDKEPGQQLMLQQTGIIVKQSTGMPSLAVCAAYGAGLGALAAGSVLGLLIDAEARLRLFVNGVDCGVAAKNIPPNPLVLLDLYGSVTELSIVTTDDGLNSGAAEQVLKKKTQHNSNQQQQQQQQQHRHSVQQQQAGVAAAQPSSSEGLILSTHDETNLAISRSMNSNTDQNLSLLSMSNHSISNLNLNDHNSTTGVSFPNNAAGLGGNVQTSVNAVNNSVTNNINNSTNLLNDSNNESLVAATRNNSSTTTAVIPVTDTAQQQERLQKEKSKVSPPPRGLVELKSCDYQALCSRFLTSLALPEAYFRPDITCYCEPCHKARGEEPVYTKGNGVEYQRPLGWCQFGLVSSSGDSVIDTWHMAYCAARPGHVRRLLDKGELLFPGELCMGWPRGGGRSKEEDSDGSLLCFSPSVAVAAARAHSTPGLLERRTGRSFAGRVLLQVAVKPGAYKKVECGGGPEAAVPSPPPSGGGGGGTTKPHTKIQWVTKERGATHLLALMIAVDAVDK